MIAILIAAAVTNSPIKCPIAKPPYHHIGKSCWDGTNLWTPNGVPHPKVWETNCIGMRETTECHHWPKFKCPKTARSCYLLPDHPLTIKFEKAK